MRLRPAVFLDAPMRRIDCRAWLVGGILESRTDEADGNSKHESTKTRKHERAMGHRFEHISGEVIGAALAVHRELGPGFLESIYHAGMRVALSHRGIPFASQFEVDVTFERVVVGRSRIDLLVAHQLVVELKAVDRLREVHFAQLKSYLRASKLRIGLLMNFNSATLTIRRMVLD